MADAGAPRSLLCRLADRGAALEQQFETSVWPWAALTGLALLVLLGMTAIGRLGLGGDPFNDRAFEAAMWRESDGLAFDCPRGEMVASLAALHLRTGERRQDLRTLLGPPDAPGAPRIDRWYVGHWSGLRIDVDTLDLQFDDADRLLRWECVQH